LGSIRLGDVTSTRKELNILKSNRQELLDLADEYKANQVQIQIKSIQAWTAWAEGKESDALSLMEEAMQMEYNTAKHAVTPGEVLPAGELYGDLLITLDKPEEALKVYEYDLLQHPNRFNGIYGAAIAAKKSGNSEKAAMYFRQLLELTENSMTERKEIEEAKKYLNI
jgi:tetratricopeptide (TPR) repeat protein